MNLFRGAAFLAVPLFLSACSGAPGRRVDSLPPGIAQVDIRLPRGGFLDCGPEVMAAVLVHAGETADVREISTKICEKELGGTSPLKMIVYAFQRGLQALATPGAGLDLLRRGLAQGVPPIVMVQNTALSRHYFLVVAVTETDVVTRDYGDAARFIPRAEFLRIWNRTGRYTLWFGRDLSGIPWSIHDFYRTLTDSPFPFPSAADDHFAWGRDLEKAGHPRLARIEYRRALEVDGAYATAALALGNMDYKEGRIGEAEAWFRLGAHAEGGCANNLAWILGMEKGRLEEALLWAERALPQTVPTSETWFQVLDTTGVLAMKSRKWVKAERAWLKGAEAGRREWYLRAAEAAEMDGRKEDGVKWRGRAGGK